MEQRKILFKGKRTDNGVWVEGYLVHTPFGYRIERWEDNVHLVDDVDPSTVCQYTGLKDMKGREIWEHDYITDYPNCGEVIFVDGGFAMHSDVGNLPLEQFVDRVEGGPLGTYCRCLVKNQGSIFDRKEDK